MFRVSERELFQPFLERGAGFEGEHQFRWDEHTSAAAGVGDDALHFLAHFEVAEALYGVGRAVVSVVGKFPDKSFRQRAGLGGGDFHLAGYLLQKIFVVHSNKGMSCGRKTFGLRPASCGGDLSVHRRGVEVKLFCVGDADVIEAPRLQVVPLAGDEHFTVHFG